MAINKTQTFKPHEQKLASIGKALAHPARVAILELLAQKKSCICNDIVNELPLSQSTVSQHLKVLKDTGIIKGNIEGPRVCYCIDGYVWEEYRNILKDFMEYFIPYRDECC